jgi:electron transfer flavoprotein alpha subunit
MTGSANNNMLAISIVRQGALPAGTQEVVAEAGGAVVLVGSGLDELDLGTKLPQATRITCVSTDATDPGQLARILHQLLADEPATTLIFPSSPDGRDVAPRLAYTLGWPLYAGAVRVLPNSVSVTKTAGRLSEEVHPSGPFVATFIPGSRGLSSADGVSYADAPTAPTTQQRVDIAIGALTSSQIVTTTEIHPPDPATMDLTEAGRIVGGGQGLRTKERFDQLGAIGASIGASLGGTRVASDAGWIPFERQIGTTGIHVHPDLYLAFAVSGATQHTSGLGDPKHVISVNTDPSCPMMLMADLAIVSDANAVLDALTARLTKPE